MATDMQSMQSSGGTAPAPKTFKPEDFSSEPVFRPTVAPPKPAAVPQQAPGVSGVKVISASHHSQRALLITIGIIAFAMVAGAIVYFFVIPVLSPKPAAPVVTAPTPTPVPTQVTSPAALTQHQSFFTQPASVSGSIALDLSLSSVQSAVAAVSSDNQPVGTFKDISFSLNNAPWTAQGFLGFALPSASKDFLTTTFEEDFTGFVSYDKNGAWPGYVFKLKAGTDLTSVEGTAGPLIEGAPVSFFQSNPGAIGAKGFTNGTLPDGKTTVRFATFAKKGSALEYTFSGSYLVISTSYQGIITALQHLGS